MWIIYFLTFIYTSHSRLCTQPRARTIKCVSITSEEQYYKELSSLETGSTNFLEHEQLLIIGNPFMGELNRHVFDFNRTKQISSSITWFRFTRLHTIVITKGNISSITSNAFSSFCRYLKAVDLSKNVLRQIPTDVLTCSDANSSLVSLNLSGNRIEAVTDKCLLPFMALENLDLSSNSLYSIDDRAFVPSSLKFLRLNSNQLKTLSERSFQVFVERKQTSLTLFLRDNHFNCDCHLRWLSEWLSQNDHIEHDDPTCLGPLNKHERSIKQMHPNEFVCEAVIAAVGGGGESLVFEGERVALTCEVFSNPKPNVWWTFKDRYTIGKALSDKVVSRYNVSSSNSADHLNVTSVLVIDQVQSSDSGDFRCIAAISDHDDVNTSDVVFHLRVRSRHFSASSSGLWVLILLLCLVLISVGIFLFLMWKKWFKSRKNSNNTKLLEDGVVDSGGLSLLAEHLGPPMYATPPSMFAFPYPSTASPVRVNVDTDENDFDISGYDEDYHFTDDIYKPGQPLDPRRLKSLREPSLLFNETEL